MEHLFVYGTLMEPDVQERLFGRIITTEVDQLSGYRKIEIRIPRVTGRIYPIITHTEEASDRVEGQILKISQEELRIADRYEGPDYKRKRVTLGSGITVWTYTS